MKLKVDYHEYLGHHFKYIHTDQFNGFIFYYSCLKCNCCAFTSFADLKFRKAMIVNDIHKTYTAEIVLTCDEYLIKNIIE